MKKIFLSYTYSDSTEAKLITNALKNEGYELLCVSNFEFTDDIQANIFSSIRRCSAFIALVDQKSLNMMFELGTAFGADKPVLLVGHPSAQPPFDISSFPIIRFDPDNPQPSISAIISTLEKLIQEDTSPTVLEGGRKNLERMLHDADIMARVTPLEFEKFVMEFLVEVGFKISPSKHSVDLGYDFSAESTGFPKIAIDVKKFTGNSKVGISHVRQLLGAVDNTESDCGILITASQFSSAAYHMAEFARQPLLLLQLEELLNSTMESVEIALRNPQTNHNLKTKEPKA